MMQAPEVDADEAGVGRVVLAMLADRSAICEQQSVEPDLSLTGPAGSLHCSAQKPRENPRSRARGPPCHLTHTTSDVADLVRWKHHSQGRRPPAPRTKTARPPANPAPTARPPRPPPGARSPPRPLPPDPPPRPRLRRPRQSPHRLPPHEQAPRLKRRPHLVPLSPQLPDHPIPSSFEGRLRSRDPPCSPEQCARSELFKRGVTFSRPLKSDLARVGMDISQRMGQLALAVPLGIPPVPVPVGSLPVLVIPFRPEQLVSHAARIAQPAPRSNPPPAPAPDAKAPTLPSRRIAPPGSQQPTSEPGRILPAHHEDARRGIVDRDQVALLEARFPDPLANEPDCQRAVVPRLARGPGLYELLDREPSRR